MTELISKNIRAQRLAQGMTQEQLAAKVFTTRQCISNYETGKSKPDYETIGKIAMAPGISTEELLYDASERRKKVRAWCILAAIIFFFGLARSLCHSNLLISNATMPGRLTYVQGYMERRIQWRHPWARRLGTAHCDARFGDAPTKYRNVQSRLHCPSSRPD